MEGVEKRVASFQPGSWKSLQTFKITIIFAVAKQSFKAPSFRGRRLCFDCAVI